MTMPFVDCSDVPLLGNIRWLLTFIMFLSERFVCFVRLHIMLVRCFAVRISRFYQAELDCDVEAVKIFFEVRCFDIS